MPVNVSRAEIWELLDDKAMAFQAWIDSGTPEASFIKTMFMTSEAIALDSPMFQNQVIPLLLNQGVIDQEVVNRINARIAAADGEGQQPETETLPGMKRYKAPVPAGTKNPVQWVGQFCDQDHYVKVEGDVVVVETLGNCTAPGVMEVTE
jgi:hypothetical protein